MRDFAAKDGKVIEIHMNFACLRCAFDLIGEVAKRGPKQAWLADLSDLKVPDTPPEQIVSLSIPTSRLNFFCSMFFLGRNWRELADEQKAVVVERLAAHVPTAGERMDVNNLLSTAYECTVFSKLWLRGLPCEFIPADPVHRRPDIRLRDLKVLVECKDLASRSAHKGEVFGAIRRVQDCIWDGREQLLSFDPAEEMEHVLFVDLPEGSRSLLKRHGRAGQEAFMRRVFGLTQTAEAPRQFPRPHAVVFSSFELCSFTEEFGPKLDIEPLWIRPPFSLQSSNSTLDAFTSKFFKDLSEAVSLSSG